MNGAIVKLLQLGRCKLSLVQNGVCFPCQQMTEGLGGLAGMCSGMGVLATGASGVGVHECKEVKGN